jgi:hypothetical protein
MRRRVLASSSSYALLSLSEAPLARTAFDQRGNRAGGAFGTAIATHAIVLLAILGLARLQPPVSPSEPAVSSAIGPFIFTSRAGDGSGRSGGGNPAPHARRRRSGDSRDLAAVAGDARHHRART